MNWAVTVRPMKASGGSSVHDETVIVAGTGNILDALSRLYSIHRQYDYTEWQVIDVHIVEFR